MERIRSGNDQFDLLLNGGFPANAIHLVMGAPGTGKTILVEQLAFANASKARPALYMTTLSEPLPKFLMFLQSYAFADVSRVGSEVIYSSLGETLADQPERLFELVSQAITTHRPGILVIDSFKALGELVPDRTRWRKQIFALASLLSAYRTTTFWVGEYSTETLAELPEFAVADGIVELTREARGSRDFRFLRVVKLRGSSFLDGQHAVQITRAGLEIFPRLRTPPVRPDYEPIDERLSSGIMGLDRMIATGWLRGSSTLVVGPSGAGKTAMALHFLRAGFSSGEATLFVTFQENPVQVARVMRHFGWDPAALIGSGKLDVFYASPVELQIDTIVGELMRRIERDDIRRIAIDGVGDLAFTAADPVRFRDYLFALAQQFTTRNVTAMFTMEAAAEDADVSGHGLAYLSDNLILLEMHLGDELRRTVRVLKTRGSAHEGSRRSLVIGPGGVVVE